MREASTSNCQQSKPLTSCWWLKHSRNIFFTFPENWNSKSTATWNIGISFLRSWRYRNFADWFWEKRHQSRAWPFVHLAFCSTDCRKKRDCPWSKRGRKIHVGKKKRGETRGGKGERTLALATSFPGFSPVGENPGNEVIALAPTKLPPPCFPGVQLNSLTTYRRAPTIWTPGTG